jgi:hypothetical protein
MTPEEFKNLKTGDLVRSKRRTARGTMIVSANYGDRVTAVDSADLTNPSEWELVSQAAHQGLTTPLCDCGHRDGGFHKPSCATLMADLVPHKEVTLNDMTSELWNTWSSLEKRLWTRYWQCQGMFSFTCLNCGFPTATGQVGCDACRPVNAKKK